ncbi:MAG TPA: FAD-dependent oxidoreductase [Trebonia sp.]|jgi:phytoene dehydrogenase-like protein|nr:FAD-dependent oxidoreductase [Trebonia sp.]
MRQTQTDIAVIGAGLAGLAAAATAAQAAETPATGTRVLILDEKSPGGRARTDTQDGFRFNRGPHAVYLRGPGHRVLNRLGVRPAMHTPPLRGARLMIGGQPYPVLSRRVLGARAAAQLTALLLRISRMNPAESSGISARDWIASLDLNPRAEAMLAVLVRVSTYVADQDRMSADIAIGQLRLALHGVGYPDEGWQALADGLLATATNRGAVRQDNSPVAAITGEPGAWRVVTLSGEEITARAVIVAAGTPAAGRRLLSGSAGQQDQDGTPGGSDLNGDTVGWDGRGGEVTAACLDLGVRHDRTRVLFGVDEPLYLSPHAPGGHLAPTGGGMVHVMRNGAGDQRADRARLEEFAASAGIADADIVSARFLPRMVVATLLPPPGTGLAGRPGAAVPGMPGVFAAGDWVGPAGWLSDCSLVSGERAGRLAARAVQDRNIAFTAP